MRKSVILQEIYFCILRTETDRLYQKLFAHANTLLFQNKFNCKILKYLKFASLYNFFLQMHITIFFE